MPNKNLALPFLSCHSTVRNIAYRKDIVIRSVPEHVNAKLYSFEKCFESYKKIEYATQILREMIMSWV
jgi:hypothetical protein